jgi:hypothetical protein
MSDYEIMKGLAFKYVAGKGYLEKVENFGADGSRAGGQHLHVASQNGLNLPYNVHARHKDAESPRTFLNTNRSHKGCVTTPVECILSSFVCTARRNMAPFRPGTFPATMAA